MIKSSDVNWYKKRNLQTTFSIIKIYGSASVVIFLYEYISLCIITHVSQQLIFV